MPWTKMQLSDGTVVDVHLCMPRGGRNVPKCSSCGGANGTLLCDGCDRPTCPPCSVSPTKALDFCPSCSTVAFRHWLDCAGGRQIYKERGRPDGRNRFRDWVKQNGEKFLELASQRTKASREAVE